jgi:hypothetical protein
LPEETSAVYLDRGREFALFLGSLRRLLFFQRHGRFLFIFPLIFDLFGHGMCSQDLRGVVWIYALPGATRDGSAVCSRHIDRQHKYTVLCASLFFDIIMTFVPNVIELSYTSLEAFHTFVYVHR